MSSIAATANATSSNNNNNNATLPSSPIAVQKSASDTRDYRYLKLKNDLSVLLISDPTTDKAGAAMSVAVGYFCDPDDIAGVAHFCEHMLLLETTKYPDKII